MILSPALPAEFPIIRHIAEQTWPVTYGNILSAEQLVYMIAKLYSDEKLQRDASAGHVFWFAREDAAVLGFIGIEHGLEGGASKLHKIYILPDAQGKGIGALLMDKAESLAEEAGSKRLILNVNRFNNARYFYEKRGFAVMSLEDIDIGEGFLMEDYVMGKELGVRG